MLTYFTLDEACGGYYSSLDELLVFINLDLDFSALVLSRLPSQFPYLLSWL